MFDCKKLHHKCKGCCCGITPMPMQTFKSNESKLVRKPVNFSSAPDGYIVPITEDLKCCFLKEDLSCAIYDDRPWLCKDYGSEVDLLMTCTYQDKDGTERIRQEQRLLHRQQQKKQKQILNRFKIL